MRAGNRWKSSKMKFARKKGSPKKKDGGKKGALQKKAAQKKRKTKGWAPFFYPKKLPFFSIYPSCRY